MEIVNPTPFAAAPAAVADLDGADLLVVIVKATYALDGQGGMAPAEAQREVQLADTFVGEEGASSVAYASDLAIGKTSTDVVLTGAAYPRRPGDREGEVGVQVGAAKASFRVFGEREWQSALGVTRMSRPEPFERIPLGYERAAGGTDASPSAERDHDFDARNPVGVGFRAKRTRRVVDASPLPNFERPDALVRTPDDRPPPAPVGFVAPGWQPRAAFAGTYDAAWAETRSPRLPTDFDVRFFDVAPDGLTVPGRLRGDEHGAALGVSPQGLLRFTLPGLALTAEVTSRAGGVLPIDLGLDRVVVDGDAGLHGEVVLVWSGGLRPPRDLYDLGPITLSTP
ncbi:DUF2169 family type VI secretion system accessory protein [Rubrivirga marina]|uniref:DUF2169 domain-containing protein n=1 Tax=Rubrivirga marina TaxID=1196024 RepID=A0A271IX19_9BACT|nr:DUF2169 domain-containing protein [Rubrivirga marina]PAP75732.1 hypothetical protein BSZ37_04400 [Rubrivirga marina]